MKELKGLERSIRLCEYVHLALITPCISLPMALFIKEERQFIWLLMALGTIIPVQLIRLVCDRVQKKWLKTLLSLAITAAATALTVWHYYWMCYLACCIPMLVSGLLLPRHKDRLIFTIPTLIALIPMVLIYALGKIYPAPLLCTVSVVLSALVTLDYFLYVNQTRLMLDIGTAAGMNTEISVTGMIRNNRRIIAFFLLAGMLILIAVPLLFRTSEPERKEPLEESGSYELTEETQEPEPIEDKNYRESPASRKLLVDEILDAVPFGIAILCVLACLVGLGALIWMLITSITKQKSSSLEVEDGMTIERLKRESVPKEKEQLIGYEKKIRRHYERLIKSRTTEKASLAVMTPTELEQTAEICGDGAETIHDIYSRTRYSAEPASREGYVAFKNAVRKLPAPAGRKNDSKPQQEA